ncbi:MAG: hypothetical protein ACXWID_00160 [Pyrinomonadaceae bacterium]
MPVFRSTLKPVSLLELSDHVKVAVVGEDEVTSSPLGAFGTGALGVAVTWLLGGPVPTLLSALTK